MYLITLEAKNIRVVQDVSIEPVPDVNWIVGGNGAGKSSILESIFLLARGRSFRGSRHGAVLARGRDQLRISATVKSDGRYSTIEMRGNGSQKSLYENGVKIRRLRDLRGRIQVRMLGENSQNLLEADPAVRRLFLDWNLFHVEHGYWEKLTFLRKLLAQRNAWLRSGATSPPVWDRDYVAASQWITSKRQNYVGELMSELGNLDGCNPMLSPVRLHYATGWKSGEPLGDQLSASVKADAKRGYTQFGPGRADFSVLIHGRSEIGSRGQNKLLVCMLQYAAQRVCEARGGGSCIWLLDDPSAELDSRTFEYIWSLFHRTERQIFATTQDPDRIAGVAAVGPNSRMFHVEQGRVSS